MKPRLAITTGEPAGIGPEIAAKLLARAPAGIDLILVGDRLLLEQNAARFAPQARLKISNVSLAAPVHPGQLDASNGAYVLNTLRRGLDLIARDEADAIVTCPVAKSVINDAGIPFTGHTEFLAEQTGTERVVMLLAGGGLRVALATTHLPLARVAATLTVDSLLQTLRIIDADLRRKFGISTPRIAVCGLNPHAGESGHMGREEIEIITPAIDAARETGIIATGPWPADTVFQPRILKDVDCVLAMYHDQGLPTLKFASFGHGINVTLGLPIIRTSVDHGTALDIAGQGVADEGSLLEAVNAAAAMVRAQCGATKGARA